MKVTPGLACQQGWMECSPGTGEEVTGAGPPGCMLSRVHQEKPMERPLIYVIVKPHFAGMFCNMEFLSN